MLRMSIMGGLLIVFTVGTVLKTGIGSISSFGVGVFSMVCPVGFLETALAARAVVPYTLIIFLAIAILTVILGRVFCGWVCPVPLTRKLVTNKDESKGRGFLKNIDSADEAAATAVNRRKKERERMTGATKAHVTAPHAFRRNSATSLVVLGVALISSFVFRFPVFCLFCPVGLIFSTLYAVIRLFTFNELVIDLIVFPAILVLEFVLLRRWCSTLCPIGALLSLFSRFNRRLVPTVDSSLCLNEKGNTSCDACRSACSYDIDIKKDSGTGHISECTKCGECAVHCPAQAIRFPWKRNGK